MRPCAFVWCVLAACSRKSEEPAAPAAAPPKPPVVAPMNEPVIGTRVDDAH